MKGELGYTLGVGEAGIEIGGPDAESDEGSGAELRTLREFGSPDSPERTLAQHHFAVAFDATAALVRDFLAPAAAAFEIRESLDGLRGVPEDIEVMDFAEEVLKFFEVVAPAGVLLGEKIFDGVAEALDADAELVKRDLGAVANGALVEFVGVSPFFEGEVKVDEAAGTDASGAAGQSAAPLTPALAIKLIEIFAG
jgi:hypothetical protein